MGPTNLLIGGPALVRPGRRLLPPTLDEVARYAWGLGVATMTPEEADAAARRSMGSVYGNLAARGETLLGRYGSGIEAIANGAKAIESGNAAEIVWATTDAVLAAVALVAPVGTIIAAIGKIVFGLARWLTEAYPAYQVICTTDAVSRVCSAYSRSADPRMTVLRDERRFWIGSVHTRGSTSQSWRWANNNENICKPYLPGVTGRQEFEGGPIVDNRFCTYMNSGTLAQKLSYLDIACRPRRLYKPGLAAPLGNRNWREWESDTAFPDRQRKRDDDRVAAVYAGAEIRDNHLIANGDPKFVNCSSDLCSYNGFLIKLSGLPNESLIEILSQVSQSAPDSLPDDVDPNTYIQLAPEQPGVIFWKDGLVEAYMLFFGWVSAGDKTLAVKALIDEYSDRVASGAISRRLLVARLPFVRETARGKPAASPSKPWTTGEKVVVAGGAAALVAVGTKLAGWW